MRGPIRIPGFRRMLIRTMLLVCCVDILFFAASTAAGEAVDSGIPTTVFYDAHIFTAEYGHPYAEGLAIRGGKIIAVGALPSVLQAAGATAKKIDLEGKFLMPGMIDAHAHPIFGGMTLIHARYPDPHDSVPDLVRFVADQIGKKASRLGDVTVIYDLDLGFWSHASDIDAALSTGSFAMQPIVLFGSDGHTAWANRLARTRAGITADFSRSTWCRPRRRNFGIYRTCAFPA